MKRRLLFLAASFLGMTSVAYSQNIKYEYDNAGNRKTRLQITTLSFIEQNYQEETTPVEELLSQNTINVYSYPVETELSISITELPVPGFGKAVLYNLQGDQMLQQEIASVQTNLQLGHFASGTYLMKLVFGSKQSSWKIIKK